MDDRLEIYVESHSDREPEALEALRRKAWLTQVNGRMSSGPVQGRLLRMLVELTGARRVLEIGTFVGYGACCLAEGLPDDGRVDTIEVDDELEDSIREGLRANGVEEKVRLHIGDALETMPRLGRDHGPYDLIYLDADKRQYCAYYELALGMLRPGGLIIADNTLWDGHVIETERHDGQTVGVREFNDRVASDPRVSRVMLPLRDGLTLIRKNP